MHCDDGSLVCDGGERIEEFGGTFACLCICVMEYLVGRSVNMSAHAVELDCAFDDLVPRWVDGGEVDGQYNNLHS